MSERLLPVGEHECVTCERCATTFAVVHPACPSCASSARLTAAETEATAQMQAKLEAQQTLSVIVKALDLRFADLGNGWLEAAPQILARIETIVDESERGFRERDDAHAALREARKTVSKFYDDHVIEGDPPCPCDACAMARGIFSAALRATETGDA